jgi:hypothetical protein
LWGIALRYFRRAPTLSRVGQRAHRISIAKYERVIATTVKPCTGEVVAISASLSLVVSAH